jgi:hypothetical protein
MLKKTLKITVAFFFIGSSSFAQWGGSTTITGDTYRNGNVGIGTTTPRALLSLGGSSGKKLFVYDDPSTNVQSGFGIDMSNTVGRELSIFHSSSDGVNGIISFGRIFETTGAYTENMRITGAGNVGIGTTNPRATLSLGTGGVGKKLLVYDNPATNVQAGFGIDMSNTGGRELTVFHPSSDGVNGVISFGRILEGTGAYAENMRITGSGNVGIGTTNTGSFKLAVEGKIAARGVKVTLANPFPDYVFSSNYELMPLVKLQSYINQNKHLPGIPSAEEVKKDGGIELGEMNVKLLEKIEELTLYVIELKKENEQMKKEIKEVKEKQ